MIEMALPENLPLEDRWRRALTELAIRDRAWFLDCEPSLTDGRLHLRFKTALHARNASERVALLLPLATNWIPNAREIEISLAGKSLLVQPVPNLSRPSAPSQRPPASMPTLRRESPEKVIPPPVRTAWRPDLDPAVKAVLARFGGSIVAVSRTEGPDLPGEL